MGLERAGCKSGGAAAVLNQLDADTQADLAACRVCTGFETYASSKGRAMSGLYAILLLLFVLFLLILMYCVLFGSLMSGCPTEGVPGNARHPGRQAVVPEADSRLLYLKYIHFTLKYVV